MTGNELLVRGRQEVNKRLDLARYRLGIGFGRVEQACFSTSNGARFFSSPEDTPTLIAEMRKRFPLEAEQVIDRARRICKHEFDLLGYERLDYGKKVDWHLDAVHGKQAPRKPWHQVRYLDYEEVGDSKIIWELNRHQHLVTLAKAYRLTGEEKFSQELFSQWFDWQSENPYPIGINWASSLEVGFRTIAWLRMWNLLAGVDLVPLNFPDALRRSLAVSGCHIERYLSTYFSPNTHLLGEGVALFFLGTLRPDLARSRRWQTMGWEIVLRAAQQQVRPDGMHFEQSTYYHVYALDFFIHARILAAMNGLPIPSDLDRTIEKMLEFLASLAQAAIPPRLGDDDGGRLFEPQRNRAKHLFDPLATGAVLFKRADFKALVGDAREETLWLLGLQGMAEFDVLSCGQIPPQSTAFKDCGIYVMADSALTKTQLVIDAGPQGSLSAGHGHADALSIHFAADGRELLADPGTYCYVADDNSRDAFRGTAAHNTLQVDGADQSQPRGPFAWEAKVDTQVESWIVGKNFELFQGAHTGYARLPQPVVHRRWVFHLKSNFWLIRDVVVGEGEHSFELSWHLSPGLVVHRKSSDCFLSEEDGKSRFALLTNEGSSWVSDLGEGWCSPVYGKKEPALAIHFRRRSVVPSELCSVLLPVSETTPELGRLLSSNDPADPSISAYTYQRCSETHRMIFAESSKSWRLGRMESDARFVYFLFDDQDRARHIVMCEGSFLVFDKRPVFTGERCVSSREWSDQSTKQVTFVDAPDKFSVPGAESESHLRNRND